MKRPRGRFGGYEGFLGFGNVQIGCGVGHRQAGARSGGDGFGKRSELPHCGLVSFPSGDLLILQCGLGDLVGKELSVR